MDNTNKLSEEAAFEEFAERQQLNGPASFALKEWAREAWNARAALAPAALPAVVEAEAVAWGMPDAKGNIVDTITEDDRQRDMAQWSSQYPVPLYTHPATASASEPATCPHCRRDDCKDFDANGCSNSAGWAMGGKEEGY